MGKRFIVEIIGEAPATEVAARIETDDDLSIPDAIMRLEQELIRRALAKTRGNRTRACVLLKISHRALLFKIRGYAIQSDAGIPPQKPAPKNDLDVPSKS